MEYIMVVFAANRCPMGLLQRAGNQRETAPLHEFWEGASEVGISHVR